MSIIDQFTSTHSDDQQQNSARVLNPETRRALDRELGAIRRLWAVILAFVPFVYASAFLWTLGLSVQLLAVLLAADMLAGIGVSMYVALRVNLILRLRGESQALPDVDVTSAEGEDEDADESEGENETVKTGSEPDETGNPAQQATASEQSDQPDPQEADDQEQEPSNPETDSDGKPADEHAETQSTDDTTGTSSERVIS